MTTELLPCCLALALGLLIRPAAAQVYAGDCDVDAEGTGVAALSATFDTGPACETFRVDGEGTTLTGAGCSPGVASVSYASASRLAVPGLLLTECHDFGLQLTASPCGNTAGGKARLNQGVDGTDLVFRRISNPLATGSSTAQLNVEFSGFAPQPIHCGISGLSQYSICAGFAGSLCKISGKRTWDGVGSFGPIATYPNDGSVVLYTSGSVAVQLLVPYSLHLGHEVNTRAVLCEQAVPGQTDLYAWSFLSLPKSGPVFVLPPDVTVDCPQLGIVDNRWVPQQQIYTDAFPSPVTAGADLNLTSFNGEPGRPAGFAVVGISGAPVFLPVGAIGLYDPYGRYALPPIPTQLGWVGLTLDVLSGTLTGAGQVIVSAPIAIALQ